jgi:hypothetical protein
MTHAQPFRGPRAKIERARSIIAEIERLVTEYRGAALVPEADEPGHICWTVRIKLDPHTDIATLVGDCVHNLRSSLDLMAVRLAELNGRSPKDVHFPFCDRRDDLEEMIKRKHFNRTSAAAQELLRQLEPYRGGNTALRGVHDLDITDKHTDLIQIAALATQPVPIRFGKGNVVAGGMFSLHDGLKALAHDGEGAAVLRPMALKLVPLFAQNQPFAGSKIIPTLKGLANVVEGVVEAFAALYSR